MISRNSSDHLNLIEENYDRLSELRKDHALVLRRLYLESKTPREIARELRVGNGGVKCRALTALKRLKELVIPDQNSSYQLVRDNQDRLNELESGQALILRRRFLENKTMKRVAAELNRGISTIANRERTALERLRTLMIPDHVSTFVEQNQSRLVELKKHQALVLRKRFLEKKSRKDVAEEFGLAKSSILHRERSALYILRKLVSSGEPSPSHLVKVNRSRLTQLKADHALILRRRFLEGKSQKETANELGVTKNCVCNRAHAALESLRQLVSSSQLPTVST